MLKVVIVILIFTMLYVCYIIVVEGGKKEVMDKNAIMMREMREEMNSIKSMIDESNRPKIAINPIKIYDERKISDPFIDPTTRPPVSQVPTPDIASVTNIATQNMYDSYHRVGLLICDVNDENKVLELMGRMLYNNYYQYFTSITIGNKVIKVNICNEDRGNKEYYNGDKVFIKELNRMYDVQMDKRDMVYYNPYFIQ